MSELSSLRADLDSTKATLGEALANLTSAQKEIGELRKQLELQTTIGKTEVPCTSEAEGQLRYNKGELEICNGIKWTPSYQEPLGHSRASAALSCQAILDAGDYTVGKGLYWLYRPSDDLQSSHEYQALCNFKSATEVEELGGDGASTHQASTSCAVLKDDWQMEDDIYWVIADDDEAHRTLCENGVSQGGDGSSASFTAKDCQTLTLGFEQPLYDAKGNGKPYWLPLDQDINVAFTNSTFGGGIASFSAEYDANYGPDKAIDGNYNTLAHGFAGVGTGEPNPWWQVRLHQQVNIKTVKVYNRKSDNCASRLFSGSNCAWQTNTGTYASDDQGFIVRVAQDDCTGDQCPGVICEAKVTKARPDNIFTLHCGENGEGIVGDRVSIQLPGSSRMLNFNELEVFGDAALQTCEINGDGKTKSSPGLTCRTIKDNDPSSVSGPYWIKPDANPAFEVYCDMDSSGGGWTLLEVLGSSILLPQAYADVGGNQANLLVKKTDFTKYSTEEFASQGKARFNAVWSVFGERTIIRLRSSRREDTENCVDYYLQRMNVDKTWDAFHAIRDVRDWGEPTDNIQTPRYGIDSQTGRHTEFYRINTEGAICRTEGSPSFYNPVLHRLSGSAVNAGDARRNNPYTASMYFWDVHHIQSLSGPSVEVSRHGIVGDVTRGCEWIFRFNGGQRSESYCNVPTINVIMLK